MGGVFVMETLSVMIRSPASAHRQTRFPHGADPSPFRAQGLARTRVIVRFWIITVITVLVGLATLKLR